MSWAPAAGGVVHSYSGSRERSCRAISRMVSTCRSRARVDTCALKSGRAARAVKACPADKLLVETDAPDQTPRTHRPAANEPAFLGDVVEALAMNSRRGTRRDRRSNVRECVPPISFAGGRVSQAASFRMHRRFDRLGRLYGDDAVERLSRAHVLVIGLGGVGSFAVESLARSGIGRLTLVDFRSRLRHQHEIANCRRSPSMSQSAKPMCSRSGSFSSIRASSSRRCRFFTGRRRQTAFSRVISITSSTRPTTSPRNAILLSECRERGLRVITTLGSAGRTNPLAVTTTDLAKTKNDRLAMAVRRVLRHEHGFPARGHFGIRAQRCGRPKKGATPLPRSPTTATEGFITACA